MDDRPLTTHMLEIPRNPLGEVMVIKVDATDSDGNPAWTQLFA